MLSRYLAFTLGRIETGACAVCRAGSLHCERCRAASDVFSLNQTEREGFLVLCPRCRS